MIFFAFLSAACLISLGAFPFFIVHLKITLVLISHNLAGMLVNHLEQYQLFDHVKIYYDHGLVFVSSCTERCLRLYAREKYSSHETTPVD